MGLVSRVTVSFCAPLVASLFLSAGLQAQKRGDFEVGLGLYERGLWEEAARHFERHLESSEGGEARSTEAWYRLASCRKKLGKTRSARKAFARVLSGDARFRYRIETRYQLGGLIQADRDLAGAAIQFERLIDEAGDRHYLMAPASYALGECRRDLGKKPAALQAFQKAYELKPKGELALASLYQSGFLLLDVGKPELAARAFGRAAKDFPKDALALECRYLEGRAFDKLARHEEALEAYRLVSARPSKRQAQARLGMARALQSLGRAGEAQRPLEDALKVCEDETVKLLILEELGYLLLDAGHDKESVHRFSQAIALQPKGEQAARLHFGRGEARSDAGQYEEALADQTKALNLSAKEGLQGDVLYARLHLLHLLGRYEESLAQAQVFLDAHPRHRSLALATFARAENLFALKRYDKAAKVYADIQGEARLRAEHKLAWCLWLQGKKSLAVKAFARLAEDKKLSADLREDALAMEALARLEIGEAEQALARADLYKLRYPGGRWVARSERVASRALQKLGRFDAAAKRLAAALSLTQGDAADEDELGMADLLQKQGDYENASRYYQKHVKAPGPIGFRALEGLAWCAFELGEIDTCRKRGHEALARPDARRLGAPLRQMLCSVELNEKQWRAAEQMARDFLRVHPQDRRVPEMRFSQALAMARGGKNQEAEKALQELLEDGAGASRDRVWYELAWTRRKLGKEKSALAAFRKVAETSQDPALRGEARLHLAESLLQSGDRASAERELAKVEGAYRSRAFYRLGFSQFGQGQHRKALKSLGLLEAMKPADAYTRKAPFLSAECHYELAEYQAAAGLYRRYLDEVAKRDEKSQRPDAVHVARARFHLGHCELLSKRADRSAAVLRLWLRDGGTKGNQVDQAQAWLWLGRAEQGRSRAESAEKAYKLATSLSEGRIAAEAWYRIGVLRRDLEKLDSAIEAFLRLSILFDESRWVSQALLEAGLCFEAQKKEAKAQKLYRELLDRYPGTHAAKSAEPRLKTKRKL